MLLPLYHPSLRILSRPFCTETDYHCCHIHDQTHSRSLCSLNSAALIRSSIKSIPILSPLYILISAKIPLTKPISNAISCSIGCLIVSDRNNFRCCTAVWPNQVDSNSAFSLISIVQIFTIQHFFIMNFRHLLPKPHWSFWLRWRESCATFPPLICPPVSFFDSCSITDHFHASRSLRFVSNIWIFAIRELSYCLHHLTLPARCWPKPILVFVVEPNRAKWPIA